MSADLAGTNTDIQASFGAVERSVWDALSPSFYSSAAWLEFTTGHSGIEMVSAQVTRGTQHLGILPLHVVRDRVSPYYHPAALFTGAPAVVDPKHPLVLMGTTAGYVSDLLLQVDLDTATRRTVIRDLVDAARGHADDLGAGEPWMMYCPSDVVEAIADAVPGTVATLIDARARISGIEGGLDGYHAQAPRRVAYRLRKERRKFTTAGLVMGQESLSECVDELGVLSSSVAQRYGINISAEDETRRFARQVPLLDDAGVVFTARNQQGELVGFGHYFLWRGDLLGRVHGVDDTVARDAALYFNVCMWGPIAAANGLGATRVDLGCDSFEAKVRRGARLDPLYAVTFADAAEPFAKPAAAMAQRCWDEAAQWEPDWSAALTVRA